MVWKAIIPIVYKKFKIWQAIPKLGGPVIIIKVLKWDVYQLKIQDGS